MNRRSRLAKQRELELFKTAEGVSLLEYKENKGDLAEGKIY
jgi:hypothetical protein